jgi:DNA adenine methylase
MRYLGGKSRIAKDLAKIINKYTQGEKPFVSLFCGSCSVESKVNAPMKLCNYKHEYLIAMWKGLQNGYELPDTITREQYYDIKANQDRDKCLTGFVGFGCSFGGKWWGGFARDKKGKNYCAESKASVNKDLKGLMNVTFACLDYRDVKIPDGAVVYADPPYGETTGYSTGKFDSNAFWDHMRKLSRTHVVLISEESAPEDFTCIWKKEYTRTLDVNKSNQPKKTEKLFILMGEKDD